MHKPLSEQVVVITGASSGIGRCSAELFAKRGAKVVLTARREDALDELAGTIGANALAVRGDVTSKEDMQRVANAAILRFGRIDTWINNAGVYLQGAVEFTTLDEYRRLLDVNFIGLVNGTQVALEHMLPRGEGVIIQLSSVAAKRGVPFTSAYSATKAAVDAFTQSLRAELWGSGIRFSIVYPPTVDTPIYQHGRGKLGVVPKPPAPIEDPLKAAEILARLAETGRRHAYFGWSRPLAVLNSVAPPAGDWLLHRVKPMLMTDIPAAPDNVDEPSPEVVPRVRGGWAAPGWKGLTLTEAVRVFPWAAVVGAAAVGIFAGVIAGRVRN